MHTHILCQWSSSNPSCEAGVVIHFSFLPCMLTHIHALRDPPNNTHIHRRTHVFKSRVVKQRWQASGSMPFPENVVLIAIPPLLRSSLAPTGTIWTPRWNHLLLARYDKTKQTSGIRHGLYQEQNSQGKKKYLKVMSFRSCAHIWQLGSDTCKVWQLISEIWVWHL